MSHQDSVWIGADPGAKGTFGLAILKGDGSATAAREGFEKRWKHDLSIIRLPSEQDPSRFWLAPIHYFWPET